MPPEKVDTHEELLRLTRENNELIKQNHEYLRKMYRNDMIGMTLRIVWYSLLIGLPFAMYFYVLQPYFEAFGSNYELFRQGIAEIPGLKGLEHFMPPSGGGTPQ
jgi:hypothetical protein